MSHVSSSPVLSLCMIVRDSADVLPICLASIRPWVDEIVIVIHEQPLPSIRRLGGEVAWTNLFVTHSGSDQSPEGRARKYERDLRILRLELAERPEHPFALFNLGMTYSDMGDHAQASEYLERSLKVSPPQETQVRKAYALLAQCYEQLGRAPEARALCERGLSVCEDDPELLFRRAKLAHDAGELALARETYERLLVFQGPRHFTSIDRGILGFKARHNLALVLQDLRDPDRAELEWRLAIADAPTFWPAWRLLAEQLLQRRRHVTTEILLAAMRELPSLALQAGLVSAQLHQARGDVVAAREELRALNTNHPESYEPLAALCELEYERGSPGAARDALRELAARQPDEASVHYNLGVACFRVGDMVAARASLARSLELRPDSGGTRQLLDHVSSAIVSAPAPATTETRVPAEAALGTPPARVSRRTRSLHVAIVTVAYNVPGATKAMIESARRECRHDLSFLVIGHSRMREKVAELDEVAQWPDVELRDYGVNRGLAKSWNEGILWGYERKADVVLVVNEDVVFDPGDVARLADAAHSQRDDKFLVMGRCYHEREDRWERSEYACFAFNPPALELLGCFDENFFPVYYEDSDFRRRARLAGLEPGYCTDVAIRHVGSASLQQPEVARQNTRTYAANRAYYERKWGGDGGEEIFVQPFNDARFSYYIDPRVRTTPYPGFDRADQQLVTL